MSDYLLALILGVVEGLTEFLPISSTAHLRIFESWMGLDMQDTYWKMFSIVIQLGAILSVLFYFWKRIMGFVRSFPQGDRGNKTWMTHPLSLAIIAFIVTAIPAFFLSKIIGENLENLKIIGGSLVVGGVIMWVVDHHFDKPRVLHIEEMTIKQAVWIGAVQILSAVFPGTSRSMSTIAGGQIVGLSRSAALEFSFFISIPTMMAATSYELLKTLLGKSSELSSEHLVMGTHEWITLAIGFVVSFIVAFGVIAWFMNWVRQRGFVPFAIYRIVFGLIVLIQFI